MFNKNFREKTNTWPAFVDLFSNLVIILIFLLIVFVFLWTTTSVFNKRTGVQTISDLKKINAEQSEKIRQMQADEEEATRLLIQARARLESAEADMNAKDLSILDLINAYEIRVGELQEQDEQSKQQVALSTAEIADLREQLSQALIAKEEFTKLEQERRELQAEMAEQMANKTAEYQEELKRLNDALHKIEIESKEQEIKYIEMSEHLNRALADKIAELQDMQQYQSEFYRSVKRAIGDTSSVEPDGDRFIVSSDILFPTGSYTLSAEGKKQLKLISDVIKEFEAKIPSDVEWIIRIDGHTDKMPVVPGNRAYRDNMQLSLLRARAVVNELVKSGVSARRLVPSGFGDLHPLELGTDAASMRKNRRIELQLTNE